MTKRRNHHRKNNGGLKAMLLTASVMATIGGARLLELQEPATAAPDPGQITLVEPGDGSTRFGQTTVVQLQPIPQAMVPTINPVARARSSM